MKKYSIRFFNNYKVRAIWDEKTLKWWYSAVDIINALEISKNPRSYWNKIKTRNIELSTNCLQLKFLANDNKFYKTDAIDENIIRLLSVIINVKNKNNNELFDCILNLETSLDEKSKLKAYELFDFNIIDNIEVGTFKGLQQIHSYIFQGLYDLLGKLEFKIFQKIILYSQIVNF